jgi:hypothetical protein
VLVVLPVFLMFTWWAVEIGLALRAYNDAKIASDAISLAAAARYRDGFLPAAGDAFSAASINRAPSGPVQISIGGGPSGAGGDVEFGRWDASTRTFVSDPAGGPAVRTKVRFAADHPNGVPGFVLPGLFSPQVFAIERSSVAVYTPPKHITSLLATGAAAPTVELAGSSRLVTRGGISVSCDGDFAVSVIGSAAIETAVVRIEGLIDTSSEGGIDGSVEQLESVPDDPFATQPLPAIDPSLASDINHDDVGVTMVAPGVHSGLSASGGMIMLQPGLHQFVGGISLSGNAELRLNSATIQLDDGFGIEVLGQASITGTPSAAIPVWSRHAVIQRSASTWVFDDAAVVAVSGDLYAPMTSVVLGGTSETGILAAVVGSIRVEEQATVLLDGSVDELETEVVPGRARLVR